MDFELSPEHRQWRAVGTRLLCCRAAAARGRVRRAGRIQRRGGAQDGAARAAGNARPGGLRRAPGSTCSARRWPSRSSAGRAAERPSASRRTTDWAAVRWSCSETTSRSGAGSRAWRPAESVWRRWPSPSRVPGPTWPRADARRARRREWVIRGSKAWITNVSVASLVVTLVPHRPRGGSHGFSLIVVPWIRRDCTSGRRRKRWAYAPRRRMPSPTTDVRLPAENVLGEPGHGLPQTLQVLDGGRSASARCRRASPRGARGALRVRAGAPGLRRAARLDTRRFSG